MKLDDITFSKVIIPLKHNTKITTASRVTDKDNSVSTNRSLQRKENWFTYGGLHLHLVFGSITT